MSGRGEIKHGKAAMTKRGSCSHVCPYVAVIRAAMMKHVCHTPDMQLEERVVRRRIKNADYAAHASAEQKQCGVQRGKGQQPGGDIVEHDA